jgi:hypothetical protein
MAYSLDITLTEFKYVTVTLDLCSGSSELKSPYVTALPVYQNGALFAKPQYGNLYDEGGQTITSVLFTAGQTIRQQRFVTSQQPGGITYTDIYLSAMIAQSIPVSPDGKKAVFSLPFGAQSKSWDNADNPSRYLITFFNSGVADANGVTTPAVLAQGYLTLPPRVVPGSGDGGGGGGGGTSYTDPTVCAMTTS